MSEVILVDDFANVGPGFDPKSKYMVLFASRFPKGMPLTVENLIALGKPDKRNNVFPVDDIVNFLTSYGSRKAIRAAREALWAGVNLMAPIGDPRRPVVYEQYQLGILGDIVRLFVLRPTFSRDYYSNAEKAAPPYVQEQDD